MDPLVLGVRDPEIDAHLYHHLEESDPARTSSNVTDSRVIQQQPRFRMHAEPRGRAAPKEGYATALLNPMDQRHRKQYPAPDRSLVATWDHYHIEGLETQPLMEK